MKHIVLVFAAVGVLIPVFLILTFYIELYFNPTALPLSDLLRHNLWPTHLWLMAINAPGNENWLRDAIIWTLSILANMLLYAMIGLIVASAFKVVQRLRRHRAGD